jgi:hypothetical protein
LALSSTAVVSSVGIMQSYSFNFTLNASLWLNMRTVLTVSCIDPISGRVFCYLSPNSLSITSLGRNVDGLYREYANGFLVPTYSRNSAYETFYTDTATFDLGIITNTGITGLKG